MFSPVRRRSVLGLLLAAAVALFPAASRSRKATRISIPSDWLSYRHDSRLTNSVPAIASPLYANGTLFIETEAGSIDALRPSDGSVRWQRTFGVVTTPEKKVGDGIVAFAIDSHCGFHRRWTTSIGLDEEPPPLVLGDVVFDAGGDRGFVALAVSTGKFLWRLKTPRATISPPIAAGGRIFAGDTAASCARSHPRCGTESASARPRRRVSRPLGSWR